MTSKNLFFKLMREDGKQRLWSFVLSMVVFFFALPVAGASIAANTWSDANMVSANIISYLNGSPLLFTITIVGALICGINGFSYLYSKKKVDFYHGIPVRRETLFAVSYVNGVLIYLIPLVFHLFLYVLLTMGKCLDMSMLLQVLFVHLCIHLAYYLVIYTLVIISVLLTGNMLTSIMLFFMFCFYVLAVQGVFYLYSAYFYRTFWDYHIVFYFRTSPLVSYFATLENAVNLLEVHRAGQILPGLGITLIVWLVMVALAVWLYRIRPSESAEKAIAFAPCKPVLYFAVSLPVSLSGAIFFKELMGGGLSVVWLVFGLICFWILIHGFLQVVMEMEFKAIFRGLIKMGVAGAISMVIMLVFLFDLTGFDNYRPSRQSFQSAAISFEGLNGNVYVRNSVYSDDMGEYVYRDRTDIAMERMTVTDYDMVMELLDEASGTRFSDGDGIWQLDDTQWTRLYVKFRLNSGREVKRAYVISSDSLEVLNRLYASQEFKEGTYPFLTQPEDSFQDIYFDNGLEIRHMQIGHTDQLRLFRVFQEEYAHMTLYDMQAVPYGRLTFTVGENDDSEPAYFVYPSMEETIRLLTDSGMESRQEAAVRLSTMVRINAGTLYSVLEEQGLGAVGSAENAPELMISAQETEKLEQLMAVTAPSYWFNANSLIMTDAPWLEIAVFLGRDSYGNDEYDYFTIAKGEVPDFVSDALGYEKGIRLLQEEERSGTDIMVPLPADTAIPGKDE